MEEIKTTKRAMWTAIASAIVHEIGTIVLIIYITVHGSSHPDPKNYPGGFWGIPYIKADWAWRAGASNMEIAMSFFAAGGLFLFLYTANVLKDLYSEEKGALRHIMWNCFLIGGLLRFFEFLQIIGIELAGRFIASHGDLPDPAWIALTVSHDLVRGLGAYIFEGDGVALMIGVGILVWFSFRGRSSENHRLSKRHGILGGVVVFFFLLLLILELATITTPVANVGDWIAIGIFGGILGLILWPAWLIWLGVQLKDLDVPASDELQTQKLLGQQQL